MMAERENQGAPTTAGEDPSVVTRNARGGEVPRSESGHRWLPKFRARQDLEDREGTPQENALRLFRRAEAMAEILLESGSASSGLFVLARDDTPQLGGVGFASVLLIWVPGDGFGLMSWEEGESRLLETYHTPAELARGRVPYRLLLAATRNLLADDAGLRLSRLQENARRLQEWQREGAERTEVTAP